MAPLEAIQQMKYVPRLIITLQSSLMTNTIGPTNGRSKTFFSAVLKNSSTSRLPPKTT